jgi:hypothetical protein
VVYLSEFLPTDPEVRVRFAALQDFREVVGLERGPLSLMSTIEELLQRKCSGSGLENRDYGRKGSISANYATPLYPQKLAVTSPTSGGRSVSRSVTEIALLFPRL